MLQSASLQMMCCGYCIIGYRSDGVVDRASASEAVDAGSIPVSGQAEDFRKLAFTASLLGVQH